MVEGRGWWEWAQTSCLIAKLHNVNCTKRSDLIAPEDVNPYADGKSRVAAKRPLASMKDRFVKRGFVERRYAPGGVTCLDEPVPKKNKPRGRR